MKIIVKKTNVDPDLWENLCELVGCNQKSEYLGLQCQAYSPSIGDIKPFECFNDAYKEILN